MKKTDIMQGSLDLLALKVLSGQPTWTAMRS